MVNKRLSCCCWMVNKTSRKREREDTNNSLLVSRRKISKEREPRGHLNGTKNIPNKYILKSIVPWVELVLARQQQAW